MSKRAAENQLNQFNYDKVEDDDNPGQGIQVADETTLSQRKIKALPRRMARSLAPEPSPTISAVAETPATSSTPKPTFTGFGGFGSSSTPTFGASSAAPSATSSFKPPASNQPSFFGSSTAPSVSPSASNATKAFASFISSPAPSTSTSVPSTSTSSTTAAPKPATNGKSEGTDPAALKYYTSLRGLNTSFMSAVSKAVDKDPFIDMADLFEQYKKHRISVQKEFDDTAKSAPSSSAPKTNGVKLPAPPSAPSSSSSTADSSKPPPAAMPAPPASFAGFGNLSSATTTKPATSTPAGGFTPASGTPASFTFGASAPAPTPAPATKPKPDVPAASSTSTTTTSSGSGSTASKPMSGFQGFTFKGPDFKADSANPFAAPPKKDSSFALSMFGNVAAGKSSGDSKDKEESTSKTVTEAPKNPFAIGGPTTGTTSNFFGNASGAVNPFAAPTSPDKNTGSFMTASAGMAAGSGSATGLGLGRPPATPLFGGFGKPPSGGGSIGNPVGFGFGSPKADESSTAEKSKSAFTFGSGSGSGFKGFGSQESKAKTDTEGKSEEAKGESSGAEGADATTDDSASKATTPIDHDAEGAGEEDEETTFTTKAAVYKLSKDKEGVLKWANLGTGMLRLKKHKETSARRILLRNSSTGRILINTSIKKSIEPKLEPKLDKDKKVVSITGRDEQGLPASYKIKAPTPTIAEEIQDALDRELGLAES